MEFVEKQVYDLTNVEVRFAALKAPRSGNPAYPPSYSLMIAVGKEDRENYEKVLALYTTLTKSGVKVETLEDKITPTGVLLANFSSKDPIYVVDSDGVKMISDNIPMIGKGSRVNIKFIVAKTTRGTFKYIRGVQLLKIVAPVMEPRDPEFGKAEGGEVRAASLPTFEAIEF